LVVRNRVKVFNTPAIVAKVHERCPCQQGSARAFVLPVMLFANLNINICVISFIHSALQVKKQVPLKESKDS